MSLLFKNLIVAFHFLQSDKSWYIISKARWPPYSSWEACPPPPPPPPPQGLCTCCSFSVEWSSFRYCHRRLPRFMSSLKCTFSEQPSLSPASPRLWLDCTFLLYFYLLQTLERVIHESRVFVLFTIDSPVPRTVPGTWSVMNTYVLNEGVPSPPPLADGIVV